MCRFHYTYILFRFSEKVNGYIKINSLLTEKQMLFPLPSVLVTPGALFVSQ